MISSLATAVSVYVGASLAVVQAAQGIGFALRLLTARPPSIGDDATAPRALVVLCLRGPDPFLSRCIRGLLAQDYPNFEVVIVVDHRTDAAWRQAEEAIASAGAVNVRIEELTERLTTCSLKCSALLQAWRDAENRYDVVANIDADVVPHRKWLRELVAALEPTDVAVATGNRWYMPGEPSYGALARYFWNAAAIVPMYWYSIAWGGTLALKSAVLRDTDYRRRIARAMCEDTMLADLLRGTGRRIAFVPALMMVNRESCTLREFYSWMRRQLLVAKLYHSRFVLITGHGLIVGAWLCVTAYALAASIESGDNAAVSRIAIVASCFFASLFAILPLVEAGVRKIVHRRDEPSGWVTPQMCVASFVAGPATLVLYVTAIVSLLRARLVRWRGIRYRIAGPLEIERLDDNVYQAATADAAAATQSL